MTDSPARTTFKETRLRSLTKSISYRIVSILGTGILTWFMTHDFSKTVSITLVNQVFLVFLYYASERTWNQIRWGKKAHVGCD